MRLYLQSYCVTASKVLAGVLALAASGIAGAREVSVQVDFAQAAYYPLLKGKASVFQEGLPDVPNLAKAMAPIEELKVRAFRALTNQGGGKGSVREIVETQGRLRVRKNQQYADFIDLAQQNRIIPILTLFQTPPDLRSSAEGSRVAPPADFERYAEAIAKFASLYAGSYPLCWEVWNEPQNESFFGSDEMACDYSRLYRHVAPQLRAADPDALIVGPAMANTEKYIEEFSAVFMDMVREHELPLDYYSIHSYGRFAKALKGKKRSKGAKDDRTQWIIDVARRSLGTDFQTVPLVFTEYERYPSGKDVPWHKNREYVDGAVTFLSDLNYFLEQTDIPFVTWNRYLNKGPGHRLGGLIDHRQGRRPIYHAFRLYGMMPTERKQLSMPEAPQGLMGFASADESGAGVMLWNDSGQEIELSLSLDSLPFPKGKALLYRIDERHASYKDGTSDECVPVELGDFDGRISLVLPAPSVVLLHVVPEVPEQPLPNFEARYIRSWQWTGRLTDGISGDYGDFDWRTWTARMGVKGETGRGLCGVTMDDTPACIGFRFKADNLDIQPSSNALLAIRVDYLQDREPIKSVLVHGTAYHPSRVAALPWAGGGATADEVIDKGNLIGNDVPFVFEVEEHAPKQWGDERRAVVSFWMENSGRESQAVVKMHKIEKL